MQLCRGSAGELRHAVLHVDLRALLGDHRLGLQLLGQALKTQAGGQQSVHEHVRVAPDGRGEVRVASAVAGTERLLYRDYMIWLLFSVLRLYILYFWIMMATLDCFGLSSVRD